MYLISVQQNTDCLSYFDQETGIFIAKKDDPTVNNTQQWNLEGDRITCDGEKGAILIK